MTYQEKQMRKLGRYQELASKAKKGSVDSYNRSNDLVSGIPLGQPILVGHHSERGHRNLLKKSHNAMGKSIELSKKAEHYENKVNNILNPRAISSDDEEAIPKLKEKLKDIEEQRVKIKKREHKSWELSNIGQNIRSVKKRIEYLEKLDKIQDSEEHIGEIKIKINKEDNRVQLFFPGKPNDEIRSKLKRNGFRWSPYNGCWQRQINEWSIHLAKEIAKEAS